MGAVHEIYGGSNIASQSLGIAGVADGVFLPGGQIESVKTWGFRGGYTHNWSPTWASGLYGGWASIQYGTIAQTTICGLPSRLLPMS